MRKFFSFHIFIYNFFWGGGGHTHTYHAPCNATFLFTLLLISLEFLSHSHIPHSTHTRSHMCAHTYTVRNLGTRMRTPTPTLHSFETDDVHEFCNVDENGVAPYISPLTPENMTFEYNHTICAVCPTCVPANMSDMCGSYKLARVFDNEATILFGVFMAVWSVTFLDFWKRIRASHVMRWNFRGMSETGEAVGHTRSQFVGKMDWFAQYVENDDDVDGNPVVGLGSKADVPSGRHPKYYKVRKSSVIDKTYTLLEVAKKILRLKSRNDMFNPAEVKAYAEQLLSCNSSAKKGTAAGLGFKSVRRH